MGHTVFISVGGDGDGVMADVDGVGDNYGLRFGFDGPLAAVVIEGDTRAESILVTEIPGVAITSFFVDDDWEAQRDEGGGVVVKGTIEVFPGGNFRVEGGLSKKVERQIGLLKKMIAHVAGEAGVNTGKDGNEAGLECLYGSLYRIVAVDVRRDKLELDFPTLCHDTLDFGADFVIEDLQVNH